MATALRKTVLAVLLVEISGGDHIAPSLMKPVIDTKTAAYRDRLYLQEVELGKLGFDSTKRRISKVTAKSGSLDSFDDLLSEEGPRVHAITIHSDPDLPKVIQTILTDIAIAVAEKLLLASKIIYITDPAKVKAELLKMFPDHIGMEKPTIGEREA